MRIAVKDASILIDLAEGDLLGLWFQLKIETHTTDLVLGEVHRESQWQQVSAFVDAGLIQKHATAATELDEVVAYSHANRISLADASVRCSLFPPLSRGPTTESRGWCICWGCAP